MHAKGDTAIWDAIALADDQLSRYGQRYPNARKRIICLSDGEDTKSVKRSHEICLGLNRRHIVVDSFCIGKEDNQALRTVSYLTGGYKFYPTSLEQAMAMCEMEPMLSQLERPPTQRPGFSPFHAQARFMNSGSRATPDIVTRDIYPKIKQHPNIKDSFVQVSVVAHAERPSRAAAPSTTSNTRSGRLLSELKHVSANPHAFYEVFVSESNMGFWKVIMQGPPQSAYSDGVFLLYLHIEDSYPTFPPKGRFCTPIFHPNINRHGRICHSIFDRKSLREPP